MNIKISKELGNHRLEQAKEIFLKIWGEEL